MALTNDEAAGLIREVADSLAESPGQFNLSITIVGMSASNTGGVGFLAAPQGGGTGFNVNMSVGGSAQVQQAEAARDEAVAAAAGLLHQLGDATSTGDDGAPRDPRWQHGGPLVGARHMRAGELRSMSAVCSSPTHL